MAKYSSVMTPTPCRVVGCIVSVRPAYSCARALTYLLTYLHVHQVLEISLSTAFTVAFYQKKTQFALRFRRRLKPNTHRRRRRDETVESRRVGVGGVYMNSRRLLTDSAMRTHNAAVWVTTADGCVHTDDSTKLSPTSCEFVYTPPTRRDSTVSSRRRRRCVLGLRVIHS